MRDATRQRLYDAENEALKYHAQRIFPTIIHVGDYVRRTVLKDKWFIRTFGRTTITVRQTRSDSQASWAARWKHEIAIKATMMNERVVLHEIAHIVRPLIGWASWFHSSGTPEEQHAAHGREFAQTYLMLVQHFMGEEAAKKLRAAYRKHKVKYTAPRQLSAEQLAGMRERLARHRAAQKECCPDDSLPPGWTVEYTSDEKWQEAPLEVALRDPNGTVRGYYHGAVSAAIAAKHLIGLDAWRAARLAETPHDPRTCEHPHCKLAF